MFLLAAGRDNRSAQALIGYNAVRGVKEIYRLRRPLSSRKASHHPPLPPIEWSTNFATVVFAAMDLLEALVRKCLFVLTPDVDWLERPASSVNASTESSVENAEFELSPLDFFRYPNDAAGMGSPNCFPHIDRGVRPDSLWNRFLLVGSHDIPVYLKMGPPS